MRTWIFVDGKRIEPADTDVCFTLASICDQKHAPIGFMQCDRYNKSWEQICLLTWAKLVRFADRNKMDYLVLYKRECWPIHDGQIHTIEALLASRDEMRAKGKVFDYWGK